MKAISKSFRAQATFKKTQLIPILTPEMVVAGSQAATSVGVWLQPEARPIPSHTEHISTATRLPLERAADSGLERFFFGLLALGAAMGIGQMLAAMIELAPNWPLFDAYVARVIG